MPSIDFVAQIKSTNNLAQIKSGQDVLHSLPHVREIATIHYPRICQLSNIAGDVVERRIHVCFNLSLSVVTSRKPTRVSASFCAAQRLPCCFYCSIAFTSLHSEISSGADIFPQKIMRAPHLKPYHI